MRCFRDSKDRLWTFALTVDGIKRVNGVLGIDLLEPLAGDPPLSTTLLNDAAMFCDVLYVLCEPGISDEDFGRGLDRESIDAAALAFEAEWLDFFPEPPAAKAGKSAKTPSQPQDLLATIYYLAGVIGINPGPLTLRELFAMASGRTEIMADQGALIYGGGGVQASTGRSVVTAADLARSWAPKMKK